MLQDFVVCLLVVPLEALKETKHVAGFIVVAGGKSQVLSFEEVSEIVEMGLLALS
jgi:hypothetical protein